MDGFPLIVASIISGFIIFIFVVVPIVEYIMGRK